MAADIHIHTYIHTYIQYICIYIDTYTYTYICMTYMGTMGVGVLDGGLVIRLYQ